MTNERRRIAYNWLRYPCFDRFVKPTNHPIPNTRAQSRRPNTVLKSHSGKYRNNASKEHKCTNERQEFAFSSDENDWPIDQTKASRRPGRPPTRLLPYALLLPSGRLTWSQSVKMGSNPSWRWRSSSHGQHRLHSVKPRCAAIILDPREMTDASGGQRTTATIVTISMVTTDRHA